MDRNEITQSILEGLAYTAGIAVTAIIYPPAAKAVGGLAMAYVREGFEKDWHYRYRVKRALNRLERRGLVVTETSGEELIVKMTQAGRRWLKRRQIQQMVIERPKHWDGIWRVVIFDIPETNRNVRDLVRGWLKRLGFARLQQSVWTIPWPCQPQFELLTSEFRLGNQALLIETSKIASERAIKRTFKL